MMFDEFLQAIRERPDDRTPLAALADWCLEQCTDVYNDYAEQIIEFWQSPFAAIGKARLPFSGDAFNVLAVDVQADSIIYGQFVNGLDLCSVTDIVPGRGFRVRRLPAHMEFLHRLPQHRLLNWFFFNPERDARFQKEQSWPPLQALNGPTARSTRGSVAQRSRPLVTTATLRNSLKGFTGRGGRPGPA